MGEQGTLTKRAQDREMASRDRGETDSKDAIQARVRDALDDIRKIQEICHVPSISFGILHKGEVIFRESLGVADTKTKDPATADTLYCLASVSKNFVSALAGIAVSEGKLDWKAPISTYLPGFDPFDDPDVGKKARVLDCLRHSAGIGGFTSLIVGPKDLWISKEEDFIHLLNQCPTKNSKGDKRYNTWNYSNDGYGLVALCLQKVYGLRYHEILQQKILSPLGLDRTVLCKSDVESDCNVARPTTMKEDGTVVQLPCFTNEDHTPYLAVMGMMSSVNDMLKWGKAIMAAEKLEKEAEAQAQSSPAYPHSNPLRNVSTARGKVYWTRPCRDKYRHDAQYCMGWLRVIIPSSTLISMGLNSTSRDQPLDDAFIIGRESREIEVFMHNGGISGSTSVFYTFPQTNSAIVVFANGVQDGCAADPTGQLLIQALFDLKPRVDIIPFVKAEAKKGCKGRYKGDLEKWHKHRDISVSEGPKTDYIGTYRGRTVNLLIELEGSGEEEQCLAVTFGGVAGTKRKLEFYGQDAYSCFPKTQDEWFVETLTHWVCETGIFRFNRDSEGVIEGLIWTFYDEELPIEFKKMD